MNLFRLSFLLLLATGAYAGMDSPNSNCSPPQAAVFSDLEQVPEGFLDMTRAQTTMADVYYGGDRLGSQLVSYTYNTVTILKPDDLIQGIPDLLQPEKVRTALSGELSSNTSYICNTGRNRCKKPKPEVAAVVFNPDRFRIDVYINPNYLKLKKKDRSKYLPESDTSLGIIQGLTATVSGSHSTDNHTDNHSLFGNSLVSWKASHLVSDWDYSSEHNFSLETLFFEHDFRGLGYGLGYLDTSSVMLPEFSDSQKIRGARIGSSMNSRVNTDSFSATPLQVFTSGHSRIEVLRDDRLIYTTTLAAGNHQLDTSSFPSGSYPVTIKIYEGTTLSRKFTRFYIKSAQLPPSDEWLWYLEGGETTRRDPGGYMPRGSGQWLMRGSLGSRLTGQSALTVNTSLAENDQAAEIKLFYLGNNWEVTSTGMLSHAGYRGASLGASSRLGDISGSYYYRQLWHSGTDDNSLFTSEDYQSHALSISAPALGGSVTGSCNYDISQKGKTSRSHSVIWSRNLWDSSHYTLGIEANYSRNNDSTLGMITMTLRWNGNNWNYDIRSQVRHRKHREQPGHSTRGLSADAHWIDDQLTSGSAQWGINYDNTGEDGVVGGNVHYDTALFGSEFQLEHSMASAGSDYTSYTGELRTLLAASQNNTVIGGGDIADSAVLVDINGSPDSLFEVLVNNTPTGLAQGGNITVVPLAPFATYQVAIRPRGEYFHDFDTSAKTITLYPGNVLRADFHSQREEVLLGKLVDRRGQALALHELRAGSSSARTDSFGLFQIRIPESTEKLDIYQNNTKVCQLELPNAYRKKSGIGLVGTVSCIL